MSSLKTAVIGVGYLGKFHAQKYSNLEQSELIAVCDANIEVANKIADEYELSAITDYHDLLGKVDAVSIVVPTQKHYEVARAFLEAGTHVLLEKPITSTVKQAEALVEIARSNNLVLQIGHLERFNPAVMALDNVLQTPQFIESHRIAPFNPRGADVNVILDLMIHDIEIIQNFVKSPIKDVFANGVPVLSDDTDVANARIVFENGCVANVTASRISMKSERKMRIFQHDQYITIDFHNKKLGIYSKGDGEMFPGVADIQSHEQSFEQGDALHEEIKAFLNCITEGKPPVVSGQDGLEALKTAHQISALLTNN